MELIGLLIGLILLVALYHEQRDIKLQAVYIGIVFAFVWVICFFANWEGAENFFRIIANFLFRKSLD
jgi:hypothetical protein